MSFLMFLRGRKHGTSSFSKPSNKSAFLLSDIVFKALGVILIVCERPPLKSLLKLDGPNEVTFVGDVAPVMYGRCAIGLTGFSISSFLFKS